MKVVKTKSLYPVSLDEVKQHLRIDLNNNEDDDYIEKSIIKAATRKAENFIGKDIALTSSVYTTWDFVGQYLTIAEGNFVSLNEIITDSSTLITNYEVESDNHAFQIDFLTSQLQDPLTLKYTTGYSDTDDVPEEIKQAILVECGNMFDMERSSYTSNSVKKNDVFERLLMAHKIIYW